MTDERLWQLPRHSTSFPVQRSGAPSMARQRVFETVVAYRPHAAGRRDHWYFPGQSRLSLLRHIGADPQRIKWISSFPDNNASNLARAGGPDTERRPTAIRCMYEASSAPPAPLPRRPWRQSGSLPTTRRDDRGDRDRHDRARRWSGSVPRTFSEVNLFDVDRQGSSSRSWLSTHDLHATVHER